MFVGDEITLGASYPDARAGLLGLTHGGWLSDASSDAYAEGLAGLVRVGPFGDMIGASKLVRVLLLEPVEREDSLTLSLRWEATGVMGPLFPVLDANIILIPVGEDASQLALAGAYRPPFAAVGQRLDRVLLHRAAAATVRSLLRRMAQTIAPEGASATDAGPTVDGPALAVTGPESALSGPEPTVTGTEPAVTGTGRPAAGPEVAVPTTQPEAGRETPA
jgi:hypothetical protein